MKRTTKVLSVVLVAVILASLLNIGTLAANYQTISVGEVVYASADVNYGKLALEFVPEESGAYAFYSMGDYDTRGYIFDSKMNNLCENDDYTDLNFYAVCNMTAGQKYYLRSELYSNDGYGEYSVTVEKVQPAEEIFIYHGGETIGYVGNYLSLECMAEPEEAYAGEVYWESDNEDVAYVDYSEGSYCELFLVSSGKANITVTTDTGLTDTVEITARDIPEMLVDSPEYLSFGVNGGTRYFAFTPESDGEYAFYTDGALLPIFMLYDSNYEMVELSESAKDMGDIVARAKLLGGETYTVEINVLFESPDFMLCVTPCVAAEGIEIMTYDGTKAEGFVGRTMSFSAVFAPDIHISEECVWSVDNEEIAYVSYQENDYCDVVFLKTGAVNLTVTTESGLSDSVELSCVDVPEIKLDEVKTVKSAEGDYFKFIPEKSGSYSFISDNGHGFGAIFDSEWNPLAMSDLLSSEIGFAAQTYMTEGETYYLVALKTAAEDIEVYITECVKATEVTLSCGSELYGYEGEYTTIEALFGDKNVEIEECYFLTNGSDVVEIESYGNVCDLYFIGAGEATIIVKTASGLSASCKVYVDYLEAEEILLNEEKTVTVGKYENDYFWFTPEEDGVYSFISSGNIDTNATLMDWDLYEYDYDDDSGEGLNFCLQVELKAGEEWIFRTSHVKPYTDGDTYTVKVIKCPPAEKMIIAEEGTVEAAVGSMITFVPEFLPAGALREEVYFRVSDRSVIEVILSDEYSCTVIVNGEGVATLEAYTDSGLYAEVTVVVGDYVAGDANGDGAVNSIDSNLLKRFIAGEVQDINERNADVNGDGSVNSVDSNLLKRKIAGM